MLRIKKFTKLLGLIYRTFIHFIQKGCKNTSSENSKGWKYPPSMRTPKKYSNSYYVQVILYTLYYRNSPPLLQLSTNNLLMCTVERKYKQKFFFLY